MLRKRSKRRFSRAASHAWKPFFEPLESRLVLDGPGVRIIWPGEGILGQEFIPPPVTVGPQPPETIPEPPPLTEVRPSWPLPPADWLPSGPPTIVWPGTSTQTDDRYAFAAIATGASGTIVAAWNVSSGLPGDPGALFVQRFDGAGRSFGPAEAIDAQAVVGAPSVAVDAAGNSVVLWSTKLGDHKGVYAQRFGADDTAIGERITVAEIDSADLGIVQAQVAMNSAGQFVVLWVSSSGGLVTASDGEVHIVPQSYTVHLQAYAADGSLVGASDPIDTDTLGFDVAIDQDGSSVVLWCQGTGVFAQWYAADAATMGGAIRLNAEGLAGKAMGPRVAIGSDGTAMAVWSETVFRRHARWMDWSLWYISYGWDQHVAGRCFNRAGELVGYELTVMGTADEQMGAPEVYAAQDGGFLVTWTIDRLGWEDFALLDGTQQARVAWRVGSDGMPDYVYGRPRWSVVMRNPGTLNGPFDAALDSSGSLWFISSASDLRIQRVDYRPGENTGAVTGTLRLTNGNQSVEGWTVFLDRDFDGVLDEDEHFQVLDASGNYQFTDLEPGSYYLCVIAPGIFLPRHAANLVESRAHWQLGYASVVSGYERLADYSVTLPSERLPFTPGEVPFVLPQPTDGSEESVGDAPRFEPGPITTLPRFWSMPGSFAVVDFNGDGIADIVAIDKGQRTVSVMTGNGDGTFRLIDLTRFAIGDPLSVRVGEFNGDGITDLLVAVEDRTITWASVTRGFIMFGNGDGSFATARRTELTAGTGPNWVIVADINGDGIDDLVDFEGRMRGYDRVEGYRVLLNRGDGSFASGAWREGRVTSVADFNSDGLADLLVKTGENILNETESYEVFLNDGSGGFVGVGQALPPQFGWSLIIGEFSGDGVLDIIGFNIRSREMALFRGDGAGGFDWAFSRSSPSLAIYGGVGDLNNDGRTDLVMVEDWSTGFVLVLATDNGFAVQPVDLPFEFYTFIEAADFNGDGLPDLANVLFPGQLQVFLQVLPTHGSATTGGTASAETNAQPPQALATARDIVLLALAGALDGFGGLRSSGAEGFADLASPPVAGDVSSVESEGASSATPVDATATNRRRYVGNTSEFDPAEVSESEVPEGEMLFDELFSDGMEAAGEAVDEVFAWFPELLAGLWHDEHQPR